MSYSFKFVNWFLKGYRIEVKNYSESLYFEVVVYWLDIEFLGLYSFNLNFGFVG